jgi:hypothetical protein
MDKITHTAADGTSTDYFTQAYTDAAVAAALAAVPTTPPEEFVPTEAQVQAAVDAGIIAAYTPKA